MLLSIRFQCKFSLSSQENVFQLTLLLGKKFTGPRSSYTLMYLSLHTKKPVLVSLKMCLTSQIGQMTWQAAALLQLDFELIEARCICFIMQLSQRQSPQQSTRGMFGAIPFAGSPSWQAELQTTQLRKSPFIKQSSRFLREPPIWGACGSRKLSKSSPLNSAE